MRKIKTISVCFAGGSEDSWGATTHESRINGSSIQMAGNWRNNTFNAENYFRKIPGIGNNFLTDDE